MAIQQRAEHSFKHDRYSSARGGNSHFLELHCAQCDQFISLYQKDGPGRLLRLYLDRVFEPSELSVLQVVVSREVDVPDLKCPKCKALLGTPMVYKPERRLAFRLIRGRIAIKGKSGER
jgi:phage FluMu protein Com